MSVALEIIAGLVAVECALLAVFFMPKLTRWVNDRTPAAIVAVTAGVIVLLAASALHVGIVVHTAQGHEPSWASVAANAVQLAAATLFIVLGWRYLDFHLEPKQAQDLRNRLRESEEGFRQVFRDSPVAKGLSGTSGPWTQVNGAFCELLGYSEGELLTLDYRAITHPVDVDADTKAREALIEGRAESDQREKRLISKNGDVVWVQRTLFSIRDEEGNLSHFYTQMLDVTARVKADAQRRELEAQLRQAQRLDSIGKLAGGVAHDFNNLLAVMINYGAVALDALEDRPEVRADVQEIVSAAERAASLTRQLLVFSRRDILAPSRFDLNEAVMDAEKLLRRTLGEDITLRTELAPGPIWVTVGAGQLEQILLNLAVNARDAMPTGGTLRVSTDVSRAAWGDDGASDISHSTAMLTVEDTGSGMEPETAQRVFEPFFTTKAPGSGTGLGLSTVYGIVTAADGSVDLRSRPGEGTRVSITLPLDSSAQAADAEEPEPPPRASGEKVLVVEDDLPVRKATERLLADHGYQVLGATTGEEALSLLEDGVRPDVLLTDVVMPGISGRELAERAKETLPHVPVVYMTGYMEDVRLRHGVRRGDASLLEKPFAKTRLLSTLHDVLTRTPDPASATDRGRAP